MDHEWWLTSASLYNQQEHLYFRDSRYFTQKQANGKPIFWSRGNGWVMGALVNVLQILPEDYPSRPKYVAQFREMAAEIAEIQSADGLWRSGLLDPDAYDLPEVSGSAFFTFGIAYGINEKILDRKTYLPVVEKSWKGMIVPHLRGWAARFDSADRWPTRASSNHRPVMSTASAASFLQVRRCIGSPQSKALTLSCGSRLRHP